MVDALIVIQRASSNVSLARWEKMIKLSALNAPSDIGLKEENVCFVMSY